MFNGRPQGHAMMERAICSCLQARLDREEDKALAWDERIRSKTRLVREEAELLASRFSDEVCPLIYKEADKMVRKLWEDGFCKEISALDLNDELALIVDIFAILKRSRFPFGTLRVAERLLKEKGYKEGENA